MNIPISSSIKIDDSWLIGNSLTTEGNVIGSYDWLIDDRFIEFCESPFVAKLTSSTYELIEMAFSSLFGPNNSIAPIEYNKCRPAVLIFLIQHLLKHTCV